jgi:hypothetical protein
VFFDRAGLYVHEYREQLPSALMRNPLPGAPILNHDQNVSSFL